MSKNKIPTELPVAGSLNTTNAHPTPLNSLIEQLSIGDLVEIKPSKLNNYMYRSTEGLGIVIEESLDRTIGYEPESGKTIGYPYQVVKVYWQTTGTIEEYNANSLQVVVPVE